VEGPDLLEYELGELFDLYLNTLETLTNEDHGFEGARYKPVTYILDEKRDAFKEKYGAYLDDVDLQTAQSNLAAFMKRLLVMRFESSKEAFRITLQNMIDSNLMIARWYNDQGKVPILKKGKIPDPDSFIDDAGDDLSSEFSEQFNENDESKYKLLFVEKDWLKPDFIKEVEEDTRLLLSIKEQWFGADKTIAELDPKLDCLVDISSDY
jgi:hypothetical protein